MADNPRKALLMVLGKPTAGGGATDPMAPDNEGAEPAGPYDEDLKTAIGDFARALGVTVKDPQMAVEAYKTMHDLCARAESEEGTGEGGGGGETGGGGGGY